MLLLLYGIINISYNTWPHTLQMATSSPPPRQSANRGALTDSLRGARLAKGIILIVIYAAST